MGLQRQSFSQRKAFHHQTVCSGFPVAVFHPAKCGATYLSSQHSENSNERKKETGIKTRGLFRHQKGIKTQQGTWDMAQLALYA